jgi:hypothetical protein
LVGNLAEEQAEPLTERLVSEMSQEGEMFRLDLFVKPLAPLASRLGPEANARFVQRVVDAMTHGASQEALRKLSGAVTSAVERVTAEQAGPLAEQLLERLYQEPNNVTRAPMITAFAALVARVGPQPAKQFSDRLESGLAIVLTRGDPSELEEQVNCLSAAALRLDSEPAREFAERMVIVMEEHQDHTLVLAGLLVAVEPHLTEDLRERAVRCLRSAMEGPATVAQWTAFLQRLERLHAPPAPEKRAAILERIVRAMEKAPDAGSLTPLVKHVAPLMGSLDPDQARRLGESMLLAAQDPRSAVLAFDALRDFSEKLAPDQLKRAVDLVMTRIKTSDPATTSWLLRALKPFAGGLEPDQASSLMDQLLTVMEQQGYTVTTMGIAANLPVVGDRLDRAQARRSAERITVALEDTADSLSLGRLKGMRRNSKLTEGLPPYSILLARTESMTDSWRLAVLCRALSGLLAKLQKDEAEALGRRIAARFEKQGWHAPLVFDETMPLVLQYAPEQSLVDILKPPFAVGDLRQAVLRAWELKTGSTFDNNLWGLVSWAATAESLKGLQLGNTPASRYVPGL